MYIYCIYFLLIPYNKSQNQLFLACRTGNNLQQPCCNILEASGTHATTNTNENI